MIPRGDKRKELTNRLTNSIVIHASRAFGIDEHADRLGDPDRVGQLDFTAFGQTGGDNVLGNVTSHVGGAAIDLGGILSAKGTTAVSAPAAVGIDDDLSARQSAIALGTSDDEPPGRIDVIGHVSPRTSSGGSKGLTTFSITNLRI